MARKKRPLLIILTVIGIAAAALAIWITVNVRNGNLTYTDHTVDIEIIPPAPS